MIYYVSFNEKSDNEVAVYLNYRDYFVFPTYLVKINYKFEIRNHYIYLSKKQFTEYLEL